MQEGINFDYYYGNEADQFTFFRIPKLLVTDRRFSKISAEAKLLYGMMLDRMSLSLKNGWLDDEDRVYIIYSVEEIMEDLGVSNKTAVKLMAELGAAKGIGLIEKIRRGLGKPDIIYVKNFVADRTVDAENKNENVAVDADAECVREHENVQKTPGKPCLSQKCKNYTSGNVEFTLQEVKKLHTNNTDINNTYMSDKSNHILSDTEQTRPAPSDAIRLDWMRTDLSAEAFVKKNIGYDCLVNQYHCDRGIVDNIVGIMAETLLSAGDTILVAKNNLPADLVKNRLLKLNETHIQYVVRCFTKNTTKVANIKQYLLAALFNSYTTIDSYYTAEVHHDYPYYAPE